MESENKSLFERAKDWIAIKMGEAKPNKLGIWFNAGKKKKIPTKEELKEFLDLATPLMQEALERRNVNVVMNDDSISYASRAAQNLYDWLSYSGPIRAAGQGQPATDITTHPNPSAFGTVVAKEDEPKRIAAKPIDVRAELELEPSPWTLEGLDDKIALLQRKGNVTTQDYSKSELDSLVERLGNRKKYEQFKEFFAQFPNTTDVLIDALVNKYKLEMKSSDLFVPEFPKEAIDVMEEYSANVKELCDKKPVFYVIAEEGDFKKKYERRDPILLVQSPFGFYYQILGAWDAEMILLSEL
jgi:DNA primase